MPTCLVVQHADPEGPYAVGEALGAAEVEVVVCRTHAGDPLPSSVDELDGVVVMGGPMSALRDEGFPTRHQEIELLARAVDLAVPTLGVCLGAQLLAVAAGAAVVAGSTGPEIGWAPVAFSAEAADDPLFSTVPPELTVLHWHGETYDLPPGATGLASSAAYAQQAFRLGDRAWGLQFHLEVDRGAVDSFVVAFGDEARAAGTTPDAIRAATADSLRALLPHRHRVLQNFAALVAHRDPSPGVPSALRPGASPPGGR
jgi:GMP synthase-like glutamine amidotransferase